MQTKASRVSQLSREAGRMHDSPKEIQFQRSLIMDICEYYCVFLEVLPTSEGDVHRLSKDRVPAGEAGSSSTCLPQKLLPLCSLQRETQVILALLHISLIALFFYHIFLCKQ